MWYLFNKVNIRVLFFENCFILRWKIFFKKIFSCTVISQWRRGIVVITTAQLHSSKPELRFCAGSYPARSVSEIQGGEDLWQWSRLEIRLKAFRWSTMPQKQFIIINSSSFAFKAKQQKSTREVIVKVERYDHKAILLTEKLNFGETLQNHF